MKYLIEQPMKSKSKPYVKTDFVLRLKHGLIYLLWQKSRVESKQNKKAFQFFISKLSK